MVGIAFQNDVKRSFSKIKGDILNLRRRMNREFATIDKIGDKFQAYASKEEFYSFVNTLAVRLDKIETKAEVHTTFDDKLKKIEIKIKDLNNRISIKESLKAEVKEVRKLRGRLAALEGKAVDSAVYSKETSKILSDISAAKKAMLTDKEFESAREKIVRMSQELKDLKDSKVSEEKFGSKIKEAGESIEEAEQRFERKVRDVQKSISDVKSELDMSVSDVELSDYVTKKAFSKKMDEINDQSFKRDVEKLDRAVKDLKESSASNDDVERVKSDVSRVVEAIEHIKESSKKKSDKSEESMKKLSDKFFRELEKAKQDHESKLKDLESARMSKHKTRGVAIGKKVSRFFRESEDEKESEQHEKKGKGGGSAGLLLSAVTIVLALVGGVYYFANQNGADKSSDFEKAVSVAVAQISESELKSQEESYEMPRDSEGAGVSGRLNFLLFAVAGLVVLMALSAYAAFALKKSGKKSKKGRKEEETVDLERFFKEE